MLKAKATGSRLDCRIEIWSVSETQTETGAITEGWTKLMETWAEVKFPITGQDERFLTDQQTPVVRANFKIRHRAGVTEKMQVKYAGSTYEIMSIVEEGRENFLILISEKRILHEIIS